MNYEIKTIDEIFKPGLLEWIRGTVEVYGLTKKNAQLIFRDLAEYENRNGLTFVCFFGTEFVIFRPA